MAVDDIISGISGDNAVLDFQPASGVEVMIIMIGMDNQTNSPALYDGTNESLLISGGTNDRRDLTNIKIPVTNSIYLRLPALGAGNRSCYAGVQIK